jgi:hypothetical protein
MGLIRKTGFHGHIGERVFYPAGSVLAATWNPDRARDLGAGLGRDTRARGFFTILGPGMDFYRTPFGGRNFQYATGEDPFLASQLVPEVTKNIQEQGVWACAKHFVCNDQEANRTNINTVIDERTLREIYLPPFWGGGERGTHGNGDGCLQLHANRHAALCSMQWSAFLLNQVLKTEWGFNLSAGVAVTLPASVEKYYWGMLQSRSYVFNSEASEYIWALYGDTQVSNGAYRGVSWFWRYVAVPSFFSGKEVTLHLRSFRQRVEVYVNQKLVGYSLIAETAYDCDISKAIKPGQRNLIAIRITNPGGNYDFIDTSLVRWGAYSFQAGRGFGGLDRGLSLRAHDQVFLSDAWVLNTSQTSSVNAYAQVQNDGAQPVVTTVRFSVIDPKTGVAVASSDVGATIPAQDSLEANAPCGPRS